MTSSADLKIKEALEEAGALMRAGDLDSAEALLEAADGAHPGLLALKLQRALVARLAGRLPTALEALEAALVIDPYSYVALLSKGAVLERLGRPRAAAAIYRDALAAAPLDLPPSLEAPTARARAAVKHDAEALEAFLRAHLEALPALPDSEAARRFDEAVGVFAGRLTPRPAEPLMLHYPRLPAIPFHDRSLFPWLSRLEAATPVIQQELERLMASRFEAAFSPYIDLPPGAPVNQWERLNGSRQWTSFWLWKDGEPQAPAQALCPETAALLADLPMADQPGFAPTAVFSALQPGAHIPPHTGSTNIRLLAHLPLVLPGPARLRVGNETRSWRIGEAWVFDDSIDHEAWNDAPETRVILIFDVWNPLLTAAERERLSLIMSARRAYRSSEAPLNFAS